MIAATARFAGIASGLGFNGEGSTSAALVEGFEDFRIFLLNLTELIAYYSIGSLP